MNNSSSDSIFQKLQSSGLLIHNVSCNNLLLSFSVLQKFEVCVTQPFENNQTKLDVSGQLVG